MSDVVRTIEFAKFGETNFHPVAAVFMVCMAGLVFSRKRTTAMLAFLAVCIFMPQEQRLVIGGLDFSMLRLITMVAWARVLMRGEHHGLKLGKLDRVVVLWVISASIFYVLRVGPSGIVFRLGASFDVLTAFFLIRVLVQTPAAVFAFWRQFAWLVIALAPFLLYEAMALTNAFGFLDYAGTELVEIRDGRARSQGPFPHPILLGTFGGTLFSVFAGLLFGARGKRLLFGSACLAATILVLSSGSSGPVMAWLVSVVGWALWPLRKHMRKFLWSAALLAVVLHFVREAPVWQLIGRLSSITGGTGYHRSRLIDAFIRRFGEWALVGTDGTAHWGWGLQDTTNQYVAEGIGGGIVTLVLFIALLRISFVELRGARIAAERRQGPKSLLPLLCWGCSVSLASHCVSFISVSYFGQMLLVFVIFIATIPGIARTRIPKRAKSHAPDTVERAPVPTPAV